jgi:RHS repeat-associated protein
VTQLGPGDSTVETHYQYDPCGRRIKAASSAGIREEFRWDSRRWLAGVMTLRAGRSQEFATHVDAFGCLTDVSGPAGRTPIAWDLATGESRLVQVGDIPALPLPDGSVLTPVSADSDQDEPWRRPATDPLDPYTLIQEHLTADISMTGGHLGVAGLAWMGARVYDSTTASFLTIDPLAAPPGSLWEAASYGYAATNPLALADPLGLRPVTDAQMRQFASTIDTRNLWDRHIRNVFSWETLGGIALATAGGLLMCFGAEVPGAMLIGAGGDMVFQQVVRGHVDYGECCLVRSVGTYGRLGTQRNRRSRNSNSPHPRDRSRHNPRLRDGQLPLDNITRAPQRRNLPEQVGGETLSGAAFGGITAKMGGKAYDTLPDSIPTGHFGPHNTILRVGKQPETFIRKYQRNGKLDFGQATSFRGATFKSKIAIKPITTYRSWSDPDYEVGGYVSRTRPAGPLQTQLDLALAPQWGNKANHISEYEIPQFAPFYEGAAGVQPVKAIEDSDTLGQLPGGGNQILITDKQVLDRWKSKK